jgi:hypothetical protein
MMVKDDDEALARPASTWFLNGPGVQAEKHSWLVAGEGGCASLYWGSFAGYRYRQTCGSWFTQPSLEIISR